MPIHPQLPGAFLFANSCPVPCKFHLTHHRYSGICSMYINLTQIKYQGIGNYQQQPPSTYTLLSCYRLVWILCPGNKENFPRLETDFLKKTKRKAPLHYSKKRKGILTCVEFKTPYMPYVTEWKVTGCLFALFITTFVCFILIILGLHFNS